MTRSNNDQCNSSVNFKLNELCRRFVPNGDLGLYRYAYHAYHASVRR